MSPKIDLTGQKFGRLTVVRENQVRKNKQIFWECKCDCGNIVHVSANKLQQKKTQSCGCLKKERFREVSILKKFNLLGQRFGRLLVLKDCPGNGWECLCDCGVTCNVRTSDLRKGMVKSCGCLKSDSTIIRCTKHGMSKTLTYSSWNSMIDRCFHTSNRAWQDYGGRGITVCDEWLDFENFRRDMGERSSKEYSLGRINNELGYYKENCRWETYEEQANNKRTTRYLYFRGENKSLSLWAREFKMIPQTLRDRLNSNWDIEKALTTPVQKRTLKQQRQQTAT